MQIFLQDLRFALRQIVRNPGFALTSILSLTLGIGATVAVYSILYDAVLHPWPYAGIERICDVWITDNAGHDDTWGLTGPQIRQLRQTHAVEDVVASNYTNQTVTGSDIPDGAIVVEMTGSHFQFLGLSPLLGRYFIGRRARWKRSAARRVLATSLAATLSWRSCGCEPDYPAQPQELCNPRRDARALTGGMERSTSR
jgi:hypothetical protein